MKRGNEGNRFQTGMVGTKSGLKARKRAKNEDLLKKAPCKETAGEEVLKVLKVLES
jgi:hypothetical protein